MDAKKEVRVMSGYAIGKREIALMYDRDELARLGIGADLRREDALALIDNALQSEGAAGWSDMEIDVFISPKALLLIGRKPACREYCFAFADAETLIRGSCACAAAEGSELHFFEGRYHLLIHTADETALAPLREFAVSESLLPGAFLREHGKTLLAENALDALKEAFAKKTADG